MKKILPLIILLFLTIQCSEETVINDCFPFVNVNERLDLNLPLYQRLLINGGVVTANIDGREIYIQRISSNNFIAFDLQCPDQDCNSSLTFDNVFITCPCTGKQYNYLQGGAPVDGVGCSALVYFVNVVNDTTLIISN